ncbi:Serine/Threonine kinase domain protein [Perilla frutescens var. hirtella]|nr:Serine/Threonine kinase domain protein [Perilla frutescens var. hirtella]
MTLLPDGDGDGLMVFQVETLILEKVQDLPKGIERENRIIQTILRQLLFALDSLHSTGIVHRDIKPQKIIFSEDSCTFKIIDLGAAADFKLGINYIPKEFLLDPSMPLCCGQLERDRLEFDMFEEDNCADYSIFLAVLLLSRRH